MRQHDLKSWPIHFESLADGSKTFEIRKDDRHYQIGDRLRLREWDPNTGEYTGREEARAVTHITAFAQQPEWIVMGLSATPGATLTGEASVSLSAEASRPRELPSSRPSVEDVLFAFRTLINETPGRSFDIRIEALQVITEEIARLTHELDERKARDTYFISDNQRLRAALQRIADPTGEGNWRTRPASMDFISLAQAVLAEIPPPDESDG